MLKIENERKDKPGYGSVNLEHAEIGDSFYSLIISSEKSQRPLAVRHYTITRALKRDIEAKRADGSLAKFSRKVFVDNASIDRTGVQWAFDQIQRNRAVKWAVKAIESSLHEDGASIDAELVAALQAWCQRHAIPIPTGPSL